MNLYSYVVRYDSGFAPNPFYGFCTLATCKPNARKGAKVGDWIVGIGSADKKVKQGGRLVYAMKVSEAMTFNEYFTDPRFEAKKPILTGSRKQARGDNIYFYDNDNWKQLDSFHTHEDGKPNVDHIKKDTGVDRVLIAATFAYFGKGGPMIPKELISSGKSLVHQNKGEKKFRVESANDLQMIGEFEKWFKSLNIEGYISPPFDWHDTQ